jgi:hypothetical protein
VCLRKAVQQEDRRAGPVRAHENACLTGLDLGGCEVIHHFRPSSFFEGYDVRLIGFAISDYHLSA